MSDIFVKARLPSLAGKYNLPPPSLGYGRVLRCDLRGGFLQMIEQVGNSLYVYASLACLLTTALVYRYFGQLSQHPLPPGPSGLPVVGNALHLPAEHQWLTFTEWAKTYGKIMHLSAFGRSFIVLNSAEAITELLEKRSTQYSDRPVLQMAGEMIGYNRIINIEPYGTRHREGRKLIMNNLSARKLPYIHQVQQSKVAQLIQRLLASPDEFRLNLRWFVAAAVFQISHGHHVETVDDPLVRLAQTANADFSETAKPGRFLVDILPFLRYIPEWVPGTGFKAVAREYRKRLLSLINEPYDEVKQQIAQGTALPSVTADLIGGDSNPTEEQEDLYKTSTMMYYAAGSDTTVSALESFFLMMILYPEVQRKAQQELDTVIEAGRLPSFDDRPRLPYIEALIKEIHRWHPVLPLALPHYCKEGDIYGGYRIPAGSTVVPNSWAALHDPAVYPRPFEVDPERYLKDQMDQNPDPRPFAFGYGRRICPGQVLAEDTLFIVVSTILATLNLAKVIGADGLPVEPDVNYTGGALSHPGPFQCTITARSAEVERLIANYTVTTNWTNTT